MAFFLHVTPAMPRKFRGDWSWTYLYGRSLFAADLCREVVIYWRNYVHSLRRAKHVQEQCGYVNGLNSGVTGPLILSQIVIEKYT